MFATTLILALLGSLPAAAQTAPVQSRFLPLALASGVHANPGTLEQMVWQQPVQIPGAAWLQLRFRAVNLPGASRLEISSFRDQHVQRLDRRIMQDWFPDSAFFNGDALLVRLFAGPATRGVSVALDGVEIGFPPPGGIDSICGPTDDRVLSSDKRVARIDPAGCTAWIGTSRGLIFTAGHCAGYGHVVEFAPDGTKVNHYGPFALLSFKTVEVHGSRQVTGAGPALPGTAYLVHFRFPDMGGASYRAALSMAQRPGIAFGSYMLNLRQDDLFLASVQGALVQGFVGTLDPAGSATGSISIPSGAPRGFTFFCSAVAVQGGRFRLGNTIGITVR
jgi:hypothetical protein